MFSVDELVKRPFLLLAPQDVVAALINISHTSHRRPRREIMRGNFPAAKAGNSMFFVPKNKKVQNNNKFQNKKKIFG